MKTEYVYHVVTERPMELGQKLIFDQQHHNGVYHRVTAFKALLCGEPVEEKLVRLLQADMDKWSKVAYREMALEKIRKEYFPTYPSRMACLYTSRTLQEAQSWAKFFQDIGRDVYSIVRLKAGGGFSMVMPATVSTACPTKKKTWKRHGIIGKRTVPMKNL